jgi:hypothetical protein
MRSWVELRNRDPLAPFGAPPSRWTQAGDGYFAESRSKSRVCALRRFTKISTSASGGIGARKRLWNAGEVCTTWVHALPAMELINCDF